MIVKEIKPGFEKEVELLLEKKKVLESEKAVAIEEAIKRVNDEFSEKENTIISILKLVTVEVEVEDPPTAEEQVDEEQEEPVVEDISHTQETVEKEVVTPVRPSSIFN